MEDGPERDATWRAAAAAYKAASARLGPERDEAPEAAINGAFAYKQVSEYDKAIEMYELFISKYGAEETLKKLEKEDPAEYEQRVKFLKDAYDALAGSYILFFDYRKAADTYDTISSIERFEQAHRRGAAQQALSLYSSMGDSGKMATSKKRFFALGASPKEQAEAEFIVANSDMKKWDANSADEGANRQARIKATAAMSSYYTRFRNKNPAAQYVVEAAYNVARMKKAARARDVDKWWKSTISAFDKWARLAPRKDGKSSALGSREADMGAEADYTLIDKDLVKKFDYETGHHRYKGTVVQVVQEYRKQAGIAKGWYDKLGKIANKYVSPEWTIAAVARQGSVYDSLRTGLFNTRPPALKMFTAKQEKALKKAEESDNLELQEKADAIRVKVQTAWRTTRDKELNSADQIVVDRYATAYVLGKRYNISNAATIRAVRRLAFLTDVIGEAKMKQFSAGVKDLNYTEKMFTRIRPGLVSRPPSKGMPRPLPVVIQ